MTKKDDESAPAGPVVSEGRGEKGRDYEPARPVCEEEPTGGRPVTHGTPLSPEEYARLKERATRGGRGDRSGPAQRDRP
jgi:hypothetical protein